jgi:hypothetical protein
VTYTPPIPDILVVTFHADGDGYGHLECNWEVEPRKGRIAESVVQRFAEGWGAELKIAGAW